jgi:hypothetical protein
VFSNDFILTNASDNEKIK